MTNEPPAGDNNVEELNAYRDRAKRKLAASDSLSGMKNDRTLGTVSDVPTRPEIDAKLAAAEARSETRFVQMNSKLDRLSDMLAGDHGVLAELKAVRADNRNTRWTILVIFAGSVLAGLGALWTTQGNLLSAFQAALATHH